MDYPFEYRNSEGRSVMFFIPVEPSILIRQDLRQKVKDQRSQSLLTTPKGRKDLMAYNKSLQEEDSYYVLFIITYLWLACPPRNTLILQSASRMEVTIGE